MQFKTSGIVTAIEDIRTTNQGKAVRSLHLEQENGRTIYPSLLGVKVDEFKSVEVGEKIEVDIRICGHISHAGKTYNNVIIDNLVRL